MSKKITFQGVEGAFSYQACMECYPDSEYIGCETFDKAIKQVEDGDADLAMIPVENSTAGRVMEVYHLLPECNLYVVGEHLLPIHHCLMVPSKTVKGSAEDALNQIEEIHSHPQGLAQCRIYLHENFPNVRQKAVWDTAGAARDISDRDNAEIAAIAPSAASMYGMTILKESIEDIKGNTTRFLILAKKSLKANAIDGNALITIIFETIHKSGSLLDVLQVFKKYKMNMTKLESYMVGRTSEVPSFYVDLMIEQNIDMSKLIDDLNDVTKSNKILGIYSPSEMRDNPNIFFFGC